MNKCSRAGYDCTKRCNWKCLHCFYRWRADFNTPEDYPLETIIQLARDARARGCDRFCFVGVGEPALWPPMEEAIRQITAMGMSVSMITNGTASISRYAAFKAAGLNHVHVSVHGVGDVLNEIAGVPWPASFRQEKLLGYCYETNWPWRMNMTAQRSNFKQLTEIAKMCIDFGCVHIVFLGFLPLYEWGPDPAKLKAILADPREISPELERLGAEMAKHPEVLFTIRYHPMCLLKPELWK
jgi:MoaA/NifB/PqqE/SkfB family radical SAM enzyme